LVNYKYYTPVFFSLNLLIYRGILGAWLSVDQRLAHPPLMGKICPTKHAAASLQR
jgi:hypothetical protein